MKMQIFVVCSFDFRIAKPREAAQRDFFSRASKSPSSSNSCRVWTSNRSFGEMPGERHHQLQTSICAHIPENAPIVIDTTRIHLNDNKMAAENRAGAEVDIGLPMSSTPPQSPKARFSSFLSRSTQRVKSQSPSNALRTRFSTNINDRRLQSGTSDVRKSRHPKFARTTNPTTQRTSQRLVDLGISARIRKSAKRCSRQIRAPITPNLNAKLQSRSFFVAEIFAKIVVS